MIVVKDLLNFAHRFLQGSSIGVPILGADRFIEVE